MTTRRKAITKQSTSGPFVSKNGPLCLAIDFLDALLDKIRTNKTKSFDATTLSQLQSLTTPELKKINRQYQTTMGEMKEALAGDAYCLESYKHFTKPQLKLAVEHFKYLGKLKHDESSNKLRKTIVRAKKEKAPSVVVKKVLYLLTDPETKMEGLKPEVLVGAQMMWIYNTKTRKLGCYYAKNEAGLTAKGTTIFNYHEKKSTVKTLRKPKEQLAKFMSGGLKFWDSIRSVPQAISPRMNRETVILKVA